MGLFDRFKKASAGPQGVSVVAPVAGRVCAQEEIPDPVFSGGMMGKALGIWPETGEVVAPLAGKVQAAMPHAIGLVSEGGVELILHIGVDTVEMAGDGFDVYVQVGEHVEAGQPLVSFDRQKVADAGFKDVVIIAVSNTDELEGNGKQVSCVAGDTIQVGEQIFEVK